MRSAAAAVSRLPLWITAATACLAAAVGCSTAQAQFVAEAGSPLHVGPHPRTLAATDFDQDGRTDLAAASSATPQGSMSVALRRKSVGFALEPAGTTLLDGQGPYWPSVADFNADHRPDLAISGNFSPEVQFLLRKATGGFAPDPVTPTYAFSADLGPGVIADFDGDGVPDFGLPWGDAFTVLTRDGADGGFSQEPRPPAVPHGVATATADFDGDGDPDVAVASQAAPRVTILKRRSAGFDTETSVTFASGPTDLATGDFNADGRQDLAVLYGAQGAVGVYVRKADNTGFVSDGAVARIPVGAQALVAGAPGELAVANSAEDTVTILRRHGAGTTFTADAPMSVAPGDGPADIVTGDFNGDGDLDFATANAGSDDVSVLIRGNDGDGDGVVDSTDNCRDDFNPDQLDADGDGNGAACDADDGSPPVNRERPQMDGFPQVGNRLTCSLGTWLGGPRTFITVWDRGPRQLTGDDDPSWVAIDNATGANYDLRPEDAGHRVRCRVTAENAFGTSRPAVSASLRADTGVPRFVSGGVAIVGPPSPDRELRCTPNIVWDPADSDDLQYVWWLGDEVMHVGQTWRPGDDVGQLQDKLRVRCTVTARNDIGRSTDSVAQSTYLVPEKPHAVRVPELTAGPGEPLGRTLRCRLDAGAWRFSYGDVAEPELRMPDEYVWLRDDVAIAGTDPHASEYRTTVDDLGHHLRCKVRASNPLGDGLSGRSDEMLVELPAGLGAAHIEQVGGANEIDPINLMAVNDDYEREVRTAFQRTLVTAVERERNACKLRTDLPAVPDLWKIHLPVDAAMRCAILVRKRPQVKIDAEGVRYAPPCENSAYRCRPRPLGFEIPSIDPKQTGPLSLELQARVAPMTPEKVLWDVDNDGDTDATCPATAPVLRTILRPGVWEPHAVIVTHRSAATGIFGGAQTRFTHFKALWFQGLRDAQVFACRTSLTRPEHPATTACVTGGTVGRVRFTGNICPIDARAIDEEDVAALDEPLRKQLLELSERLLRAEDQSGATVRFAEPDALASVRAFSGTPQQRFDAAVFQNTQSAVVAFSNRQAMTPAARAVLDGRVPLPDLKGFHEDQAPFATDQIYIARGPLTINGVTIEPKQGVALLLPSEVDKASEYVHNMTLNVRASAERLGNEATGVPLGELDHLTKEFSDAPKKAADELMAGLDIDKAVREQKANLLERLHVPFKIAGSSAKVTLNDDGTASLHALAELPLLRDSSGNPLRVAITASGDRDGNLHLDGVKLGPIGARLGAVDLEKLVVNYDSNTGLDVRGQLLFANYGIDLQRFQIDNTGRFRALDVAYLAGAGGGIPIGSGILLTRLGGGYANLEAPEYHAELGQPVKEFIHAGATVSVGPSTGGGCSVASLDADFYAVWDPRPFTLAANGKVKVVCMELLNIRFKVNENGFVELVGEFDYRLGPIFAKGGLGFRYDHPRFQAQVKGDVGVHIPLLGTVKVGGELVFSNQGLAGCARIELPILPDLVGGAGIKFPNGHLTLNLADLISGIRFFTGCDLGEYKPFGNLFRADGATGGARSFDLKPDSRGVALSIEGAGAAPHVRLRSPSGKVLDFTTSPEGAKLPEGIGVVIEDEDRTVVILGKPEAGRWTVEPTPDSPPLTQVKKADILPKPAVRASVSGQGAVRRLGYDITPIDGQEVRFVQTAPGATKTVATVKRGGRGQVRFAAAEATGQARTIVAEVSQHGLPRASMEVARFRAPNPRVGRVTRLRVRRRGTRALITWNRAPAARRYEVTVRTPGGGRLYFPVADRRQVTVPGAGRRGRITVSVVAISAGGRRGPAVRRSNRQP